MSRKGKATESLNIKEEQGGFLVHLHLTKVIGILKPTAGFEQAFLEPNIAGIYFTQAK
jgi:hypothetical protein